MIMIGTTEMSTDSLFILDASEKVQKQLDNFYFLDISRRLMKCLWNTLIIKCKEIDRKIIVSDNMARINNTNTLKTICEGCYDLTSDKLLTILIEMEDCGEEAVHRLYDIWRGILRFGNYCSYALDHEEEIRLVYI